MHMFWPVEEIKLNNMKQGIGHEHVLTCRGEQIKQHETMKGIDSKATLFVIDVNSMPGISGSSNTPYV